MDPSEDAMGQALMNYNEGRRGYEVVERDDGYLTVTDVSKYFSHYSEWPQYEKESMNNVKGRVLDIGCGAGRHSLYLQNKGFDVLGVDISPLAIKVCKLRGLKKSKEISIEELNFKPNTFDTILMMGNNFGLFGSFNNAQKILKRLHGMTTEGALIVASSMDVYQTSNSAHFKYQEANREKGRMSGQIRLRIRYRQYSTLWYDYLIVSKKEMEDIFEDTGWQVQKYIDSDGPMYISIINKHLE